MTHFDHEDGLADPCEAWDDDSATDCAYDRWLDEKLGVTQ